MNKEITCRLIEGKPVVEYKEEYVPKKGDIVVSGYTTNGGEKCCWISIYDKDIHGAGYFYQARLLILDEDSASSVLKFDDFCNAQTYTRKASIEEAEVMHHILSENGYELIGDTVVKKRWIPEMGDLYYYVGQRGGTMKTIEAERRNELDSAYLDCFKTEQACQSACDKINELLLTLPQE